MLTLPPKVTPRAFARLAEIGAAGQGKALRVGVKGGGCSGFEYLIDLDEPADDDLVLEGDGEKVVVDSVSLPFLARCWVDLDFYEVTDPAPASVYPHPNAGSFLRLRHMFFSDSEPGPHGTPALRGSGFSPPFFLLGWFGSSGRKKKKNPRSRTRPLPAAPGHRARHRHNRRQGDSRMKDSPHSPQMHQVPESRPLTA